MKNHLLKRTIIIPILLLLLAVAANAQTNKIVDAPGTTYDGTYIYQGTYNGKPYYSTGTYYLYVNNHNGTGWYYWHIYNQIWPDAGDSNVYYVGEDSNVNPEDAIWYEMPSWNIVTITITDEISGVAPTVSTSEASLVTTTSGTIGGNVVADGGATVTARGLVYSSTDATPTIGEAGITQIPKGTGTGSYTELVSPLTAGVAYYFQAYGTNTYGTTYGGVKSFTTPTTSQPNKLVSGITSLAGVNGVYVWIGEYYGKPAWKHQTSDYWIYYSHYSSSFPSTYYWYIDDELKDNHSASDYLFYHADAATCPASGWTAEDGTGTVAIADYPQIEFTDGATFSPGNPLGGTTSNPIGRFFLDADIAGASLTAATISVAGVNSGVTNLKLWSSTDATFNSSSDTQLNSQADGATVTFSGFSSSIATSGTYYFVTADLDTTASGSFTLTIGSKANLTISGGAIASDFSNAPLTSGEITIIPTKEINVKGNSNSITDGDATPSLTDHTDFGSADISTGSVVRTFTIENLGAGTLAHTDPSPYVVITGATSDFSLTQIPSNSIPGASSTTFQVTFNPTATGTRSATISIANDDGDENPYNFAIQGTGTAVPEMDIAGNGTSIGDGDSTPSITDDTDFGNVDITSGSVEHTFTITNSGSATLSLTDASPYVAITGAASDYSLTLTPSDSIAAGGGTTTFRVTFNPTTTGTRSATISIANNDSNENPYNFSIQGTGITVPTLTTSAAASITAITATLGGNITSDGGATVTARGVVYSTSDNTPTIGEPGVTQDSNGSGTGVFSESIGSLSQGTTYYFQSYAINSIGTSYGGVQNFTTLAPEINIQGNSISIADGDTTPATADDTDFGSANIASGTVVKTFTIQNSGTSSLALSGSSPYVTISGTNAADFSISAIPSATIAASASTTFQITFAPSAAGTRSATLSIANNDSDENPYNFSIQGTGFGAPTTVTDAASDITTVGVTLNGTVNANNQSTTVTFTYGLTTAYGTTVTAGQSPVSGTNDTSVSSIISGLFPNSIYHYRVVGQNKTGTTYGIDQIFATTHLNLAPTALSDIFTTMENEILTVHAAGVLSNDSDPENNPLNARLISHPGHGRVTFNVNGSFNYAPNENYNGTDRFTYVANDGELDSNTADVTIRVGAVNDPPTVRITSPLSNEMVSGLVTIRAEAQDDDQVAAVSFYIDGVDLANSSATGADKDSSKTLDLGDCRFDISAGLVLALDHDSFLLLLTPDLQWRYLAGPEAGIMELCSDNNGAIYLRRQYNGSMQWLKINQDYGQAKVQDTTILSCRSTVQGETLLLQPPVTGNRSGTDERIVIYNNAPWRVELQRGEIIAKTWILPLTQIKQIRRVGYWLALEGSNINDSTICLLNTSTGTMQLLEFGSKPPTTWDVLANGALLVSRQMQANSPGVWGIWQYSADGWKFTTGQALPCDLAMLATLPATSSHSATVSGMTNGTYTKEWNTLGSVPGLHTIKVVATDNEGLTATDSVEVYLQNIVLTLDVKRLSEKLWIIRHDYADIAITIDSVNGAEIASYILERNTGNGWLTVREIAPGDFQDNRYSYKDTDIETNKQYTYRVRAVDSNGATIAGSQSVTI